MDTKRDSLQTTGLEDIVYYMQDRLSKDYFNAKKAVLASFDDILTDYAGSFGRFQVLLILLNILLGMCFLQTDIAINIMLPRTPIDKIKTRCVPLYKEISSANYKFSVIDNVFTNIKDKCNTFMLYKRWDRISKRENLTAYVLGQEIMMHIRQNRTLPADFAKQVSCYDDYSSAHLL
ncbi:uncharacterized protein LOC142352924 [Convolutriloba macropyga]|uniref:uncharacterized protein LOC142352924 n=1 Tax=Convolutriloba macropyga TaxID=536237 RepID=UPI003F5210D1